MISSETDRNKYTGNDTTADYDGDFKIFDEDHILVKVRNTTTEAETTLTKTTDYTVADVGEEDGFTISLVDAAQAWISASSFLDSGWEIVIVRDIPFTQATDFANQDDFYPEDHETQFDRIVMMIQQLNERVNRCVKVSEIDYEGTELVLPAKDDRASGTFIFDASGNPDVS